MSSRINSALDALGGANRVVSLAWICAAGGSLCLTASLGAASDLLVFFALGLGLAAFTASVFAIASAPRQLLARDLAKVCIAFCCAATLGAVYLLPAWQMAHEIARRANNKERAVRLAEAIVEYSESQQDRRLPPVALYGVNGEPLLSWRVLILPYIGREDLFRRFRLNEPWDSVHNLPLLSEMPETFGFDGDNGVSQSKHLTYWQVLCGGRSAFSCRDGCRVKEDLRFDLSRTVLLVESNEPVPWTKPSDVDILGGHAHVLLGGGSRVRHASPFFGSAAAFSVIWGNGSVDVVPCDEPASKVSELWRNGLRFGESYPD